MAGIEPATDGLRNRCSTTELHWRPMTYAFCASLLRRKTADNPQPAGVERKDQRPTDNPTSRLFVKTNIPQSQPAPTDFLPLFSLYP